MTYTNKWEISPLKALNATDIGTYLDSTATLSPFTYNTYTSTNMSSTIKGFSDLNVSGNLVVNGVDIGEAIGTMCERMAILMPDPAKLEKWESLRKAYEHYKLMEKLIGED
jgi:hypothetical protein